MMAKLGIIFLCIALGVLLRRYRIFPENAATTFNKYVIYIALPALVLHYIHQLDISHLTLHNLLAPALMPWMLFLLSWLFISIIGRLRNWDRRSQGALILTAGLGNTAFVGFAIIDALYGARGMQVAVIVDQLGSFLALSTLGVVVAVLYSGKQMTASLIVKKVVTFPPFIALVTAFLLIPFTVPTSIDDILQMLSGTLVPIAMLSVGMQLRVSSQALQTHSGHLLAGLGYKLLLAPAVFYLLYALFLDTIDISFRVIILEAAMAPMVTAGILASEYDLRGEIAALMVGVGIPISLFSVPFLNYILW